VSLTSDSFLRLVSIVEATSVTGPVKPLLMFSALARDGRGPLRGLAHRLITTRRAGAAAATDLLGEAVRAAGIEYVTVRERAAGDPAVLGPMRQAILAHEPDLVETHDSKSHFVYLLLRLSSRRLRRIPWVAFHHGYTRVSRRVLLYQQLDRVSLRHATRVNTLCLPFAADLERRGVDPGRINVLTNAVTARERPDDAALARKRAEFGARDGDCVIVSIGRLSNEKGHADLLQALERMPEEAGRAFRLVIAGDGPERAALERLASPFGDRVKFLGHVADPWILYCAADMFALPSHSEGSPLVMFEAMAAGLPIIATRVGGIPEVLTDGSTAVLVAPKEVDVLASKLAKLIGDARRRRELGDAAREALQRFSPDSYADRLLAIYAAAIEASSLSIARTHSKVSS
jgi:glycosyltransferase involved in cell wall biosynthesis